MSAPRTPIRVGSRVYNRALAEAGVWDMFGQGTVLKIKRTEPLYASGQPRRGTSKLVALVEWDGAAVPQHWESLRDLSDVADEIEE